MAEEEETREVLFPDWEGPDQTGLTIEQTGGEIFVKEVKGESPAARSGKVYEGDQIVGATIYFDNMSSEETAELLKTLNRHKVGLKLQNKGDKSPLCSPLGTPCRSPMGTLTWEGKTRFGGSSPDIILGGDEEDYKRIYTKKIKPRLKSEDLAEGVDVRTERHSSTSSDGNTITTITRRITTYTVDMPSDISEQLELSSPEFKGLKLESGDGSPGFRITHGSTSVKEGAEEGVFESGNVSKETRWGSGVVKTTITSRETEKDRSTGLRYKGPSTGKKGDQADFDISRASGEKGDGRNQVSETNMAIINSGTTKVTIGSVAGADVDVDLPKANTDVNIKGPKMPGLDIKLRGSKVEGDVDVSLPNIKGDIQAPEVDLEGPDVDTEGSKVEFKMPKFKGASFGITGSNIESPDVSLSKANIDVKATNIAIKAPEIGSGGYDGKIKGPTFKVSTIKGPKMPDIKLKGSKVASEIEGDIQAPEVDIEGPDVDIGASKGGIKMPTFKMMSFGIQDPNMVSPDVDVNLPKANIDVKAPEVDIKYPEFDTEGPDAKLKGLKINIPTISGPKVSTSDVDVHLKGLKLKGEVDMSVPKIEGVIKTSEVDITGPKVDIERPKGVFEIPKLNMPSINIKGPTMEGLDVDVNLPKANIDVEGSEIDIEGPDTNIRGPKLKGPKVEGDVAVSLRKTEGDIQAPGVDIAGPDVDIEGSKGGFKIPTFKIPSFSNKGTKVESPDVDVNLPKVKVDVKGHEVDIKSPEFDTEGPDGKLKGPKFTMSTISGPKVSIPDVDVHLKSKKLKGQVDMSEIEREKRTPEVDIKGPKVDIEGPKAGFDMPKTRMPTFNLKGAKIECPDIDVNIPKANVDVKGSDVDIKAPEIDIEGPDANIRGAKLKMPTTKGVTMPDLDIKLKGPKVGGNVDVSLPKMKGNIQAPDVDIAGPDVDIEGSKGGFKLPKLKVPTFGIEAQNIESPDVDVNLPTANIDVKAPGIDIKALAIDIGGPDAKIEGPKFTMPKISGPELSMPDIDTQLKSPKLKGNVDISAPKIEGEIKTPEIDIKGPNLEKTAPKFKLSTISGPKMSSTNVDISMKGSGLKGDLKGDVEVKPDITVDIPEISTKKTKFKMPKFGIKGPKVKGPQTDVSLKGEIGSSEGDDVDLGLNDPKIKGSKFKMPKFGSKGQKTEMPEVDLNVDIEGPDANLQGPDMKLPSLSGPNIPDWDISLKGPKVEGNVSVPKIEGNIKASKIDIEGTDLDLDGKKAEFKMPNLKTPSFGIKGLDVEAPAVDVSLPEADVDIRAPDFDIKGPEADLECPSGKIKGPTFKMPTITGPHISMPDVDFNVKGPRMEGPDINLRLPKGEIDVKVPDIDIKAPEIDIKGPDANLQGPKNTFPSSSGPKLPDWKLKLKGPKGKGDVDVPVPKTEGNVKAPAIDIEGQDLDLDAETGGFKMPKIKMPSFGFKGTRVGGPEVDVSLPEADIDIGAPDVDIKGPEVDLEGPSGKIKGAQFKIPTIKAPNISMPDVDLNMKGPNLKGGVDVSVPKIEGDIKGPKVDIEGPDVDLDAKTGGFKMPKFKIPSFGFKGTHVEGPGVDVSLPEADIDIRAPDVDIKGPEVDLEGPSGKIKGSKFKIPNIKGPQISMPDVDVNLKGPNWKSSVDVSGPKIKGDIGKPDIDFKGPGIDIEGPNAGFDMPKIKMPTFKGSKMEGPDFDVNLPKADIDVNLPSADVKAPEIDIEAPDAKLHGPNIKLPSISGPKLPEWDLKLKGPKVKGDVDVSVPKIEGDIKGPKIDIEGPDVDLDGKTGGFKMPKFKMPSFGFKGSHGEGPEVDVSLPEADIDIRAPDIDIKGPEVDLESPSGKIKGPKFKIPTITGPNISMPDVDFNLKGPNLKGGVDVSVPKIKGDIGKPDIDFKGPGFDIEGPKAGFDMPKIKMPTFKGSKMEGPDIDVNLPRADIDVNVPSVDIKAPAIDIEGPDANLQGPRIKFPSISGPKLSDWDTSFKGPTVKGDVSIPKIECDIKGPNIDSEGPDVDIDGKTGGFKMPKFKIPSFGFKGSHVEGPEIDVSLPEADIDIRAPDIDIKGPEVDLEGPSGKIKGPKFQIPTITGPHISMPDVDFKVKGPNLKGGVDLSVPKIKGDIGEPDIDIKGPGIGIEGTKAGFEMPKVKVSNLKGPKMEGSDVHVNLPKADIGVKIPGIDIKSKKDFKAPDLNVNLKDPKIKGEIDASVPSITVEGGKTGITFPKFKGPKFGVKSPEIEGPDSMVKSPKFSVGAKGTRTLPVAEASLDAPDIDISVKGKKGKFKLPKVKTKTKKSDLDIEMPAVNLDVDTPSIHVKGTKVKKPLFGKLHFPDVELDIKSPKLKGEHDIDLPSGSLNTSFAGSGVGSPNVSFGGSMPNVKGGAGIDASVSGSSGIGRLQYPEGTVTFPKIKVPKFGFVFPQLEGQECGGNVETELLASGGMNLQSPSVSCQASSQHIEDPSSELKHGESKVKVKMPNFFGKSKAKGSSASDIRGPEVEFSNSGKGKNVSKDVNVFTGEVMVGKLEVEGDPRFDVSTKGKSASLDLFKKSRHRSSLSDEEGLAVSSPSVHLAEGGDISLDLGGSKVKGKKSKLKFGTFGGFGSKSKGSYEVALGEDSEAGAEGSASLSLPSKKSRLSSSSSSDSGSRGAVRFPRVELSVSPKK